MSKDGVRRYRDGICVACGSEPIEQPPFPEMGWRTVLGPRCRGKKVPGMFGHNIWLGLRRARLHEGELAGTEDPARGSRWTPLMLSDVFLGGPGDVEATDENMDALAAEREAASQAGEPWPR